MKQVIRIQFMNQPFINVHIQRTPLFFQKKQVVDTNENAIFIRKNHDPKRHITIYDVKPLTTDNGIVYIQQFTTQPIHLEVFNKTEITGNLILQDLQIASLSVEAFKEIVVYNTKINTLTCEDRNKVKILGNSGISKIKPPRKFV